MIIMNRRYVRGIDSDFINELNNGVLTDFLNLAKRPEYCLEIRRDYLNIYYKGGSTIKITQLKNKFRFDFDTNYCLDVNKNPSINYNVLNNLNKYDPKAYSNNIKTIQHEMVTWLSIHRNYERDFQHNLIKLNQQDFIIVDIEYAGRINNINPFRIDMLAIYNDNGKDKLVIVENKFGNNLTGKAGIKKHYDDITKILNNIDAKTQLIESVNTVLRNKIDLGLISKKQKQLVNPEIEILFILANFSQSTNFVQNKLADLIFTVPTKVFIFNENTNLHNIKIDYSKATKL